MKFKVGDKVRVKSLEEIAKISNPDSKSYKTYYEHDGEIKHCYFNTPYMKDFCGKVFTIKGILSDGRYSFLEKEANTFVFIDAWLKESIKPIYVSSFDEDAEIVETEETEETEAIIETLEKEQFIEKILDLEPSIEQCLKTDCEECDSPFCVVKKMKHIIQRYKGV